MLKEVSLPEQKRRFEEVQVSSLEDTAETIKEIALKQATMKVRPRDWQNDLTKLLARRDFVAYFNDALSLEVAKVIASYDKRVQAVYLFKESANPDAQTEDYPSSMDLTIHLLTLVTSASAALEAFITSLDRTLTEALNDLPSEQFAGRTSYLNVVPITEVDIEERRGYAVLLSSIYARPLKIWQRE
jgi:hypothetical protein